MAFVIDASTILSWHFPDERNASGDAILRRLEIEGATAPAILWFELRNVLLLGERRGRSTRNETEDLLRFLQRFIIDIAPLPDDQTIFTLARRHRLTFYDAAYLELAQREQLPLATLDRALADAAKAEGFAVIGA